jgi:hypothetical protein
MWELAKLLKLIVDTRCTCSVNPITDPNPVYSRLTRDNMMFGESGRILPSE